MEQDWPGFAKITFRNEPSHVDLASHDLLFLQRPIRPGDVAMLKFAKSLNVPVVIDYDDDYTAIPAHNPRAAQYMQKSVQDIVRTCLTEADVVMVSTPALKLKWAQLNKRIVVVPNGLDDRTFVPQPPLGRLRPRTVVWRGGDSHQHDLAEFGAEMTSTAWEVPGAVWHFFGNPAGEFVKQMPPGTVRDHPFVDVLTYFQKLAELRPHILVVPLADTFFNRCKSNISIIEGSWAGAAVVAPAWPGWGVPGVYGYRNVKDFGRVLRTAVAADDETLAAMRGQAWDAVRKQGTASRFNMFRAAVFSELVKEAAAKRFERTPPVLKPNEEVNNVPTDDDAARRLQEPVATPSTAE